MSEDEECFYLYVAEQLVPGLSLNFFINRGFSVSVDILRYITGNILQALQVLHRANVVHKNLRHSSIFLDSFGEVKVGDYSLESRINEIFSIQDDRPSLSMYPSAPGRGGKRGDIHRLGILLWTLYQGNIVHRWDCLKLPSSMPLLLRDLIGKCIGSDIEKDRMSIDELLSHAFLKTPIFREHQEQEESRDDDKFRSDVPQVASRTEMPHIPSRLLSEFETLQFLGSGGFGDVLKVRNKLDGNIYAIKRILLDAKSRQLNKKITREVKLLSRLNHENIVRYYNSWLETVQTDSPSRSGHSESRDDPKVNGMKQNNVAESDSSDLSHSRGPWFIKPQESSSSGGIEFDSDGLESSSSEEEESSKEWQHGMERIKVLSSLRLPEIVLPVSDNLTGKEVQLINWLLNHNPSARPSSTELLQSPILPPPQLEEAELQEMIRHTLSNTQSKAYKHLVASCFQQKMTISEDLVYNMDMTSSAGLQQSAWIFQAVQEVFVKHCQRRGAIYFKTTTLSPKKSQPNQGLSQVLLMNHVGSIVTLPTDLQTPFARFISRSNLTWLKRYCIDYVYSERKLVGLHPKSFPELAFDIVTPSPSSVLADAEVLVTISDVFSDQCLKIERKITLELGHHLLLKGVLIHCGIPEDKRSELCHILKTRSKSEGQIQNKTAKLAISRQSIDMLLNLLESRKGEAASLAKQALHELDAIATHAECMGLRNTYSIRIDTALQNYTTHWGMVFRFVCRSNLRKTKIDDVLATGGRYDALVRSFQNALVNRNKVDGEPMSQPTVVGGFIHLDRVAAILKETEVVERNSIITVFIINISVCFLEKGTQFLYGIVWS
ncbi:LOW QUALITY PROTEIN: eIF-2-alpha kinase GCN2-like [Daphnia pulicaria]|uniref:LOW QUALITY PROTEIN: eIF-2-alpha kinase GCN2-like n=1 Tax=Daphnia pulicaria TaxID=35523 RepID=UPI001EEC8EB7|nr:LOW QUALITY PROTEIN: eIF-2-alpha kinase GCN2-like [Daphnia pulicaria]